MTANQVDLSTALEEVSHLLQQRDRYRASLQASATQLSDIASTAAHRSVTKRQVTELYDQNRRRKVDNEALSAETERLRRELQRWTEKHHALQHQTKCADQYLDDVRLGITTLQQQLARRGPGTSNSPGSISEEQLTQWTEEDNSKLTTRLQEYSKQIACMAEARQAIAKKRALASEMVHILHEGELSLQEKSVELEALEDELERRQQQREAEQKRGDQ